MRIGEKEKKDREPFALLCKCNIASEGLPGCRLWETEEERSWRPLLENQLILDRAAVAGTTSRIDGADRLAAAADRGGSGCSGSATWPSLQSSQASGERPRMDQSTIGSSATSLQLLSVCFLHFKFHSDFLNIFGEELIILVLRRSREKKENLGWTIVLFRIMLPPPAVRKIIVFSFRTSFLHFHIAAHLCPFDLLNREGQKGIEIYYPPPKQWQTKSAIILMRTWGLTQRSAVINNTICIDIWDMCTRNQQSGRHVFFK